MGGFPWNTCAQGSGLAPRSSSLLDVLCSLILKCPSLLIDLVVFALFCLLCKQVCEIACPWRLIPRYPVPTLHRPPLCPPALADFGVGLRLKAWACNFEPSFVVWPWFLE